MSFHGHLMAALLGIAIACLLALLMHMGAGFGGPRRTTMNAAIAGGL